MALVLKDRVKETTTTTGTGTITLAGASTGYQSFSVIGNANTTYYCIAGQGTAEWEVGIGTYTASGTTLSRDTILASSNSGSVVTFSAGTKDVFVVYPAGKSVNLDASGNATALGTPASCTVTNFTGTASININGTVGATTPNTGAFTTLSASGVATFSAGSAAAPAITTSGDTNTGIFFPAADTIAFTEGGAEAMRIDSSGNVGIGTTSPGYRLEVSSGTTDATALFNSTNVNGSHIRFASSGTVKNYIGTAAGFITAGSADDLGLRAVGKISFATNGAAADMTIDSSGNVGIGTTAPTLPLTVDGEISTLFDNNGTALEATAVFIGNGNSASTATHARVAIIGSTTGTVGELYFTNRGVGSYNSFGCGIRGGYAGADARNNTLTFFTSHTTDENVERVRIESTGNVGIGTSSPTTKTQITKAALTGFVSRTAATLTLENSGDTELYFASGNANVGQLRFGDDGGNFRGAISYDHSSDGFLFYTAGTERMRIDTSGNVGIGTSSLTGYSLRVGKQVTGAVDSVGVLSNGLVQSDVTSSAAQLQAQIGLAASAFTLSNAFGLYVGQTALSGGAAITSQYGVYVANSLTGATNNYGFYSNIASGSNRYNFYANGTAENYFAGNVGIGSVAGSTTGQLRIAGNGSGATTFNGISLETSIQSGVTASWRGLLIRPTTQATAFTLSSLYGVYINPQTFGAGSTVTNQYGVHVENTLTGATNNYGFYSNIASGSNRYNFYANGTADNYFAGNVGIGTSSPTQKLDVSGKIRGYLNNTSVGNASSAQFVQDGTGDAAISFLIGATTEWLAGVDNSDSDSFKISNITGGGDFTSTGLTLTTSGNVGIGTSSPYNNAAFTSLSIGGSKVGFIGLNNASGTMQATIDTYNNQFRIGTNGTSNPIVFNTGGSVTEAMRIDSSGNVGIGTSSPSSILHARKDQNTQTFFILQNNNAGADASSFTKYTNGTNNAYVGMFNGSSGGTGLNVPLSMSIQTDMAQLGIGTVNASGILTFYSGSAVERMRIDSSGNLLVGKTADSTTTNGVKVAPGDGTTSHIFIANTTAATTEPCLYLNRQGATGAAVHFRQANTLVGNISVTASATSYNTSSDYRLKENIAPMTGALAKVAALNPVTYTWKADGSAGEGFIAHELQAVVPDCVTGEKDAVDAEGKPVYQGVDTSFLVATLTAAIQELKADNDDLRARIAALEAQ